MSVGMATTRSPDASTLRASASVFAASLSAMITVAPAAARTGATSGLEQAPLSVTTAILPSMRNSVSSEIVHVGHVSTRRSTQLTWPAP